MSAKLVPAALLCLAAAMPAAADTYKWVDARGVVNYSNAPPPESAKSGQVVGDRISVMGMDPSVRAWAERRFAQQAYYDELDWQRRQRGMIASYYTQPPPSGSMYGGYGPYSSSYPYSYGGLTYYPTFVGRSVMTRTVFTSPPRASHSSRGSNSGHSSRGSIGR
ncbi:MAG TPA: DUF4124 domain-containing protein [Burkholderiales bacterium]|nr:DUF4124 domain-containing protein [Burkholderiales bacterium]